MIYTKNYTAKYTTHVASALNDILHSSNVLYDARGLLLAQHCTAKSFLIDELDVCRKKVLKPH